MKLGEASVIPHQMSHQGRVRKARQTTGVVAFTTAESSMSVRVLVARLISRGGELTDLTGHRVYSVVEKSESCR